MDSDFLEFVVWIAVFIAWLLRELFSGKKPTPSGPRRQAARRQEHPSFQPVARPQTPEAHFQGVPSLETLMASARAATLEAQELHEPKKPPAEVVFKARRVSRKRSRVARSVVPRQVTEALLLGDILLEPRSRGR